MTCARVFPRRASRFSIERMNLAPSEPAVMIRGLKQVLFGVAVLAAVPAAAAMAQSADDFGHGSMTVQGEPADGERDLLVILQEYDPPGDDRDILFDANRDRAHYENLFSGPDFPNVEGYFTDQSEGVFTWRARVVGPITNPDDPDTGPDERYHACANRMLSNGVCPSFPDPSDSWYAGRESWRRTMTTAIIEAARQGGVDYRRYDDDGDGEIRPDELVIARIGASTRAITDGDDNTLDTKRSGDDVLNGDSSAILAGPNRQIDSAREGDDRLRGREAASVRAALPNDCVHIPDQDVRVCTTGRGVSEAMGSFQEAADFDTIVHELAHTLGTIDLYGSFARMHSRITIMGPTLGGAPAGMETYNLDPWHKIALGWIDPRLIDISTLSLDEEACRAIAPETDYWRTAGRPLLLFDSSRPGAEFYLIEARRPHEYDRDLWSNRAGFALWYVHLNNAMRPKAFNSAIQDGNDNRLDSSLSGDDRLDSDENAIVPGPNGRIDSRPSGDDRVSTDLMNFHLGANSSGVDPTVYNERGTSSIWRPIDAGSIQPRWFGGDPTGLTIDAVFAGRDARMELDLLAASVDFQETGDLSPDATARAGEILSLSGGHYGVSSANRRVKLTPEGAGEPRYLRAEAWRCDRMDIEMPASLAPGDYTLSVERLDGERISNVLHLSVAGSEQGTEESWTGAYAGRSDGRPARLEIRRAGGDIPELRIEIEELDRGGLFTGSVTPPTGDDSHIIRDLTLRREDGSGEKSIEALILDTRNGDHVTGVSSWRGNEYGLAFAKDGLNAGSDYGRLDDGSLAKLRSHWEGVYFGRYDGKRYELRIGDGESGASGARFQITLTPEDAEHPNANVKGEGVVRTGAAREMTFSRPLSGAGELFLRRLLIHTWNTGYISAFGELENGESGRQPGVGGYFVQNAAMTNAPDHGLGEADRSASSDDQWSPVGEGVLVGEAIGQQELEPAPDLIRAREESAMCIHKPGPADNWRNGNRLHVWACDAGAPDNKSWEHDPDTGYIRAALNPDVCIHKAGPADNWENGASVHIWACDRGADANKTWAIDRAQGYIRAAQNRDKCIHKAGGGDEWDNGTIVHLWDCDRGPAANKSWSLD